MKKKTRDRILYFDFIFNYVKRLDGMEEKIYILRKVLKDRVEKGIFCRKSHGTVEFNSDGTKACQGQQGIVENQETGGPVRTWTR